MGDAFKMTRVRMEIAMEHGNESVVKKAIAVIDETKFNSVKALCEHFAKKTFLLAGDVVMEDFNVDGFALDPTEAIGVLRDNDLLSFRFHCKSQGALHATGISQRSVSHSFGVSDTKKSKTAAYTGRPITPNNEVGSISDDSDDENEPFSDKLQRHATVPTAESTIMNNENRLQPKKRRKRIRKRKNKKSEALKEEGKTATLPPVNPSDVRSLWEYLQKQKALEESTITAAQQKALAAAAADLKYTNRNARNKANGGNSSSASANVSSSAHLPARKDVIVSAVSSLSQAVQGNMMTKEGKKRGRHVSDDLISSERAQRSSTDANLFSKRPKHYSTTVEADNMVSQSSSTYKSASLASSVNRQSLEKGTSNNIVHNNTWNATSTAYDDPVSSNDMNSTVHHPNYSYITTPSAAWLRVTHPSQLQRGEYVRFKVYSPIHQSEKYGIVEDIYLHEDHANTQDHSSSSGNSSSARKTVTVAGGIQAEIAVHVFVNPQSPMPVLLSYDWKHFVEVWHYTYASEAPTVVSTGDRGIPAHEQSLSASAHNRSDEHTKDFEEDNYWPEEEKGNGDIEDDDRSTSPYQSSATIDIMMLLASRKATLAAADAPR